MLRYHLQNEAESETGASAGDESVIVTPPPVVAPAAPTALPAAKADDVKPTTGDDLKAKLAEVAQARKSKLAELEQELQAIKAERARDREELEALKAGRSQDAQALRTAKLDALLDTVKLSPDYREFARERLADVDPSTDAGKAAVDAFAAKYPAMIVRPAGAGIDETMAQAIAARAKANPGSAWGFIPPSALAAMKVE